MRVRLRTLLALGAVAAVWLVAYFVVIPALVSDAYVGQSFFPPLNRAIEGQSQHPLAYYQSLARRIVLLASAGCFAALAAAVAAWRWQAKIAAEWNRLVRTAPTIGVGDMILSGTWFGFVSGLADVIAVRLRFGGYLPDPPLLHVLWMGPFSAASMGAIGGALLALVLRAWRGVSIAVPVVFFSSFALCSFIATFRLGIHQYAIVILGIGVAAQLGRLVSMRAPDFPRLCRRSLPWMGGVGVVVAFGIAAIDGVREHFGERFRGTPPEGAPNVLLLILDTVRAQDLSLYGYERETSPEIVRLASTGVTFDRAIATTSWTLPSHASMFTGLPPDRLSTDFHAPLDAAAPTIAEVLRTRGYATGGFVANMGYTSRPSGLDRGFSAYRDDTVSPRHFLNSSFWMRKAAKAILPAMGVHGPALKTAAHVNREFLSWMPSDGRPFFAFLNYIDAHSPYRIAPPFDRKFRDPPPRFWRFEGWKRWDSEADIEEFRVSYNSAIAYVDAQVGALLREMEQRGVLRNTLVILAADHGEHLGEHGGIMSHANSLYLPLLHVPLVMSYPSRLPVGGRVTPAVSTQDIPATILDVLGFTVEPAIPGRSLARYWNGEADDGAATDDSAAVIFSELTYNDFAHSSDPIRNGRMQSLIRGRLHYIRNGDGSEELYDYIADADERKNLSRGVDSASLLAPFRQLLAQRGAAKLTRTAGVKRNP